MGQEFTHLDDTGQARMVDIAGKGQTLRNATATAKVFMSQDTVAKLNEGEVPKARHEKRSEPFNFFKGQKVFSGSPFQAFFGHAISATEIASISY